MGDGVGGGCYGGWCGRRVLWGMVWEEGVMGDGVMRGGCWGMVLWKEGVMGDGVGGGCYGRWYCERSVLWEDGVVGMVLWKEGVVGGWCCGDGV